MFTRNIKHTVQLGKSGVRWEATLAAAPGELPELANARLQLKYLQDYKTHSSDEIRLKALLNNVHSAIESLSKKNIEKSQEIEEILAQSISTEPNPDTKKVLQDLQEKRKVELDKAKITRDKQQNQVTTITQDATRTTANAVAEKKSNVRNLKDIDYKIERDGSNQLTASTMSALLADFDAMSGIEVSNRSILRQAIFGGGKQKEVVGEAQVYELLSRMDKSKLNDLYRRVTGDSSGLPWNPDLRIQNSEMSPVQPRSRYDFDVRSQAKIERFQRELADQTSMMADIFEKMLGKGARAGLQAVLEGRTDDLRTAISDPTKIEAFKRTIAESKELDRDPNYLVKVVSFLIKLGIQVPLSLASSGMVGGYAEATDIIIIKGKDGKLDATRRGSLTIGEGNKSGNELSATADILGIRLDAKWNSPTARITGITDAMIQSTDYSGDAKKLTEVTIKSFETKQEKGKAKELSDQVQELTNSYLARIETIKKDTKLNPEQKKEVIANITLTYLSRIEAMKGTQLEGVFAAFNTAGGMIGFSGGRIDNAATFSGVREGSARVEAEALARVATEAELRTWLDKAGVKEENGVYVLPNGGRYAQKNGATIKWIITEEVHEDKVVVTAMPDYVDIKKGTAAVNGITGDTFIVKRENFRLNRTEGMPTDKEMADFLLNLRRSKGGEMSILSRLISDGSYEAAKIQALRLLEGSKSQSAKKLLTELKNKDLDLKSFFDLWLEKTSGGSESRALADKINKGTPQKIESYYEKNGLYKTFGEQYGLTAEQVKGIITSYGELEKSEISTLGSQFKDGFHALTAYAQINGKGAKFGALDPVTNVEAQIIGESKPQSGEIEKSLKEKIKASLKTTDLADYRKGLPEQFRGNKSSTDTTPIVSDDEVKAFVIDGALPKALSDAKYTLTQKPQVYTYLSYSTSAECFNLGTVISSPSIKAPDTSAVPATPDVIAKSFIGTGATVGYGTSHHFGFGIGVGRSWKEDTDTSVGSDPNKGDPVITPKPIGDQ